MSRRAQFWCLLCSGAPRLMLVVAAWMVLRLVVAPPVSAGIGETVHNLSVSGPGEIRAMSEERICIFCHAPHGASTQAPLWNRRDSRASYLFYESSTLDALVGQPTGATRLCLSCHDGTVALGELVSEPREIELNQPFLDLDTGSLETDLADDHPVSFVYDHDLAAQDLELESSLTIRPPARLDADGRMQCTSCHDPHDNSLGSFLLVDPFGGALCTACHRKSEWELGTHATSTAGWDGTAPDPWPGSQQPTVAGNACRSCHTPHAAAQPRWLLRHAPEEQACLVCHGGHVAELNLEAEFAKPYRHPLDLAQGIHEPGEDSLLAPRHVECTDCHDPHQATGEVADAPAASGKLKGARGIDAEGLAVASVRFRYEVCFACHGDASDTNQEIPRVAGEINTRLEFSGDAISSHPVVRPGINTSDPTLRPPYTEASQINCTDCHASDSADSGGSLGPHGSQHRGLLRRRYETDDFTPESPLAYDLCYQCHSRSVLLDRGRTNFATHRLHVETEQTSCSICHDPHGIASSLGDPSGNTHLINFDLRVVEPNASGRLRFEDRGFRSGACYLSCHGSNHDPKVY